MKNWQKTAGWMGLIIAQAVLCLAAFAADDMPTLVEVQWQSKKQIAIPSATSVIPVNPDQVNAEFSNGVITLYGVARGAEAVVLVFVGDQPHSVRINVVDPPSQRLAPQLRDRSEFADVTLSSSMQTSSNSVRLRQYGFTNGMTWGQSLDPLHRFDFSMETTAASLATANDFNLNHGSLTYSAPKYQIQAIDLPLNLYGNEGSMMSGALFPVDYTSLRGAAFTFRRTRTIHCPNLPIPQISNSLIERKITPALEKTYCSPSVQDVTTYKLYAGTTQPYYFLSLHNTSDIVGFSFNHKVNQRFTFFGNSVFMNVPVLLSPNSSDRERQKSGAQSLGLNLGLGRHWHFSSIGGVSTNGGMGRVEGRYLSHTLDAGAGYSVASAKFPYNQLLSRTSGNRDLRANAVYHSSDRLSETFSYTRSTTVASTFVSAGTYTYIAPGIDFLLNSSNDINVQYARSESNTTGAGSVSSNQYNASWNSLLPRHITNTVQLTIGSQQDPLQLHTGDEWNIRESVRMPISHGDLSLSFGHNQTDPSLVQRLAGRLGLLPLSMQEAFLNDPVGFLNSGALPDDVRAVLQSVNPTGTYFTASGQFQVTRSLMVAPTASFSNASDGSQSTWSPSFGYALHWNATRSLQVNSNLSNLWYTDSSGTRRTSVFAVGVVKQLYVAPASLLPIRRTSVISGRVFRDNNINGAFNSGEPGLAGIHVQLDGKEIVTTDADGRYRFTRVSPDTHEIRIAVSEIKGPIRMTTPSQQSADMVRISNTEVNFGVVNFARVMGLVFNDRKFTGTSDLNSRGLQKVRMVLKSDAVERTFSSEGSGEYETTDVPPGDYQLIVDQSTLPANYWVAQESIPVHVDAVSTSIIDVPVRALRSIGGRVLMRIAKEGEPSQNGKSNEKATYDMLPVPGITIVAGDVHTQTAADGSFLLRNLPAGDLVVTLAPVKPLPEGMALPSGRVHMPDDPMEVHDATIVISNPDLMPYLVGKTVEQIRNIQPLQKPAPTYITTASK
jgi:hypothetical protein